MLASAPQEFRIAARRPWFHSVGDFWSQTWRDNTSPEHRKTVAKREMKGTFTRGVWRRGTTRPQRKRDSNSPANWACSGSSQSPWILWLSLYLSNNPSFCCFVCLNYYLIGFLFPTIKDSLRYGSSLYWLMWFSSNFYYLPKTNQSENSGLNTEWRLEKYY